MFGTLNLLWNIVDLNPEWVSEQEFEILGEEDEN